MSAAKGDTGTPCFVDACRDNLEPDLRPWKTKGRPLTKMDFLGFLHEIDTQVCTTHHSVVLGCVFVTKLGQGSRFGAVLGAVPP